MSNVPGFSLVARVSSLGDISILSFKADPANVHASIAFKLKWQTQSVPKIQITGGSYDSGVLVNNGSGQVTVSTGITVSTIFTINGLDNLGNQLYFNAQPVTMDVTVSVT